VRFWLHGRIDRIDQVAGGFEAIDYKTGSKLTDARNPRYAEGRILQHALYALAVEQLLGPQGGQVLASSYYFPVMRAKQPRIPFPYPDKGELADVLRTVLEPLRTGAFAHTNDTGKDCGYCEFRSACVAQDDARMLAKQDQAENAVLECRKRLRTVR
jgi:ATP-dependent helicase/nuclease subunit B